VSVAGIASAWLSGSARVPFVAGLDRYLPPALSRLHPRYGTPHVALLCQAVLSGLFVAMSFMGTRVEQAFKTLVDLAVVLQLIPFLYLYAALVVLARRPEDGRGRFSKATLWFAGLSGLATSCVGTVVAFIPQRGGEDLWMFEAKMALGIVLLLGLGAFFYFPYARRRAILLATAASTPDYSGSGGIS